MVLGEPRECGFWLNLALLTAVGLLATWGHCWKRECGGEHWKSRVLRNQLAEIKVEASRGSTFVCFLSLTTRGNSDKQIEGGAWRDSLEALVQSHRRCLCLGMGLLRPESQFLIHQQGREWRGQLLIPRSHLTEGRDWTLVGAWVLTQEGERQSERTQATLAAGSGSRPRGWQVGRGPKWIGTQGECQFDKLVTHGGWGLPGLKVGTKSAPKGRAAMRHWHRKHFFRIFKSSVNRQQVYTEYMKVYHKQVFVFVVAVVTVSLESVP